ncbi:MAG: hypothetical protein ACFB51_10665, partial [Anaerolineae bacterium]
MVRAIWVLSVILMLVPTVAGGLVRYPFLLDIGYSPAQATARVSLAILYLIVFGVTGIIIYIRRQDDWVAMLVSLMLFAIATSATDFPDTLVDVNNVIMETDAGIAVTSPSLFIPADLIRSMGLGLPFVVLMVFPSGLAVPRWVRWPLLAHVLWIFARPFLFWLEPIHPIYWSGAVETIWLLGWTALA